jgi:hypothetical protein
MSERPRRVRTAHEAEPELPRLRQVTVAHNWFGLSFSYTQQGPRSALHVPQVTDRSPKGTNCFDLTNSKRKSVDFFHAFVRSGSVEGKPSEPSGVMR